MTIYTGSNGSDNLTGSASNDVMNSGNGDDSVYAGAGNDRVDGGAGDDTLDGGSGSDQLNGGSGNDTFIYTLADNAGATDVYSGGSGSEDTVVLKLTSTEWLSEAVQREVGEYLRHLAAVKSSSSGEVSNGKASDFTFQFDAGTSLTVSMMERLEVRVDGASIDIHRPSIGNANGQADVVEDQNVVASGPLSTSPGPDGWLIDGGDIQFFDVDWSQTHTVAVLPDQGALGGLLTASITDQATDDGQGMIHWDYGIDNRAVQHLGDGEVAYEYFTIVITDSAGQQSTQKIVVTVTGTNDGPVAVADSATGNENQTLTLDVLANDTDVDTGHAFTLVSAAAPQGQGTAGVVNNQLVFSPGSDFDSLPAGASKTVTLSYTMADEHGAQSTASVTVTVTGTNDGPVAVADSATGGENQTLTLDVLANDTDVDAGHAFTLLSAAAPQGQGTAGVVNNQLVFSPGSDFDSLPAGASKTVTLSYTMADEHGAQSTASVTVTVTGTNDVPVAQAAVAAVAEDDAITGSVSASDADTGETATLVYALTGAAPAGLSFHADGSYSFDASSYDQLTAGKELVLTVPFTATDTHGATSTAANLVITVTGTNDVPVAQAAVAAVAEDDAITGSVSASDADTGETASLVYALTGAAPAGLSFHADGSYSFDASSYDQLTAGKELVLTVPFTATDTQGAASTAANLVITVTGTNDVPVAQAAVAAVAEDDAITGSVSASDADTGETATLVYALTGAAPAGLSFHADGSYSFDASSYDQLTAGKELVLTVPFTATDTQGATSTAANLVITVTGTNDVPVAQAAVAAVAEDDAITGSVSASDADTGETASLVYALTGAAPAGLSFHADGSYSFDASSYDQLTAGKELVLTVPFTATDTHGATSTAANLVITVTGTNDVPVAQAAVAAVAEDDAITGSVSASDADTGETASLVYALTGAAPAGLSFHADGSYSFDASSYDQLTAGKELVLTVPFSATDTQGATSTAANLVITVTGTNDVPVAQAAVAAVAEDDAITGSVSASDADAGETASLVYALVGAAPAGLSFHADGSYSFDASSYDQLALGEPLVLTVPFTATDVHGITSEVAELVITINGSNDAPVAMPDKATTAENQILTLDVLANDSDADRGDQLILISAVVPAGQGSASVEGGKLVFDPGTDFDHLAAGATETIAVSYTMADEHGALSEATATVTVTGTNDVPIITVASTGSVTEDANVTGAGQLTTDGKLDISDKDDGQSSFSAQDAIAGSYGVFTIDGAGHWTYTVNNSLAAIQSLKTGDSLSDTFTATSSDGSASQLVTVTIKGTDEGTPLAFISQNLVVATVREHLISANGNGFDSTEIGSASDAAAQGGGASKTYQLVSDDSLGAFGIDPNTGNIFIRDLSKLDYEGAPGHEETGEKYYSLQVSVSDGSSSANATFKVYVTDVAGGSAKNGPDILDGGNGGESLNPGNGADTVFGDGGADTITGDGGGSNNLGADVLYGGGGNDILVGLGDSDVLVGGIGADILTGGSPGSTADATKDTFKMGSLYDATTGRDTITDFNTDSPVSDGSRGDVLDIHDLVSGFAWKDQQAPTLTTLVAQGFLSFSGTSNQTVISFDSNGSNDGGTGGQLVLLQGVAFSNTNNSLSLLSDNVVV